MEVSMNVHPLRFDIAVFAVVVGGSVALSQARQISDRARPINERADRTIASSPNGLSPEDNAMQMIKEGRWTFRYDTFGDEEFWGDALGLHRALAGEKLG